MAGQESNASLFPVEIRCEHFGFSIQVAFLEVRKRDLRLLFLLNHTNILFLSTWVFELHRNLILTFTKWGRGNTRNYFRSRSTMQLPFMKYNFHSRSTTCFNIFFTTIPHSLLPAWISWKGRALEKTIPENRSFSSKRKGWNQSAEFQLKTFTSFTTF